MKKTRLWEIASGLAIFLNIGSMILFGYYQPIVRYRAAAQTIWERANDEYSNGDPAAAYVLYVHLAGNFPRSIYGEKAAFKAPRTAQYRLGRPDLAEEGFRKFLAMDAGETANIDSARKHLAELEARKAGAPLP